MRIRFWEKRKWFVSHTYRDSDKISHLLSALPSSIEPIIFPPIELPITEFVSERLLQAIDQCESLVVLDTDASSQSFWVPFEIEYAKRRKKPVFRFNVATGTLVRDREPAIEIPIYVSFAHADEWRVRQIALWSKAKRGFSLWYEEQIGVLNEIFARTHAELRSSIERGGYLVAFVSEWSATRGNLRNEVHEALRLRPGSVFLAWLDDPDNLSLPDISIPSEMQIYLRPRSATLPHPERENEESWPQLSQIVGGPELPVLSRDLDDLIVRIYWMKKQGIKRTSSVE